MRNRKARRDPESAPLDRFNAFSDGVFAIAITLLVLELPMPAEGQTIVQGLTSNWGAFLGYFISFSIIGGVWMQHSSITKFMREANAPSYAMNLLLLFFVGLLPFTTKLFVEHLGQPQFEIAELVYGINILLASMVLSFLMMYVASEPRLLKDEVADDEIRSIYTRRWVAIGVNVVALFLVFLAPFIATAMYLLQSLLLLVSPLTYFLRSRTRRGADADRAESSTE